MNRMVQITHEDLDRLIVEELQESVDYLLKNPWAYAHSYEETFYKVSGMLHVLEHYMVHEDFEEYAKEIVDDLFSLMLEAARENLQNTEK